MPCYKKVQDQSESTMVTVLMITSGHRTFSGQIVCMSGKLHAWPDILTDHVNEG